MHGVATQENEQAASCSRAKSLWGNGVTGATSLQLCVAVFDSALPGGGPWKL
jgi:hypothetical protein